MNFVPLPSSWSSVRRSISGSQAATAATPPRSRFTFVRIGVAK